MNLPTLVLGTSRREIAVLAATVTELQQKGLDPFNNVMLIQVELILANLLLVSAIAESIGIQRNPYESIGMHRKP
jgi:hypothetical protein